MKNYIRLFYADVEVGAKLTLDGAAANKTMKEFKQEIKAANEELLNTSARFGATSKEALAAAKRVAELKDNIQDANETAKLFDPGNKFQVLGNAVRGLVGGFAALQGALALVGVEGEEVQRTLLKVQGALALTEGLNTVADVTKDFKRLGAVLVQTLGKSGLIGVAIAGVAALGIAFYEAFINSEKLTEQQVILNEVNEEATKIYVQERLELDKNVKALQSENTSREDKRKIIDDLQKTYPNYFQNLDLENGKVVGLTEGYNRLVKAISLKARATAAANLLAKQEEELLSLGFKAGITTEEEARQFLKRLDTQSGLGVDILKGKVAEAIERRQFLQNIIAESDAELAKIGGDPKASAPKIAAIKARVKEEARLERELRAAETAALPEINLESIEEQERLQRYADGIGQQMTLADRLQAQFRAQVEERIALAQLEEQQRTQAAYNIGSALGALSQLIGEQTAAGKALAIAQAVINTWLGVTDVLKSESVLPQPLRTIQKIASIATVVATGLAAVRNIGKAKIPGKGGGGGGSIGSVPAPIQARLPQATNTIIDQNQINQIGNATVRAFVVESDVSSNQERIRRLNRAARI